MPGWYIVNKLTGRVMVRCKTRAQAMRTQLEIGCRAYTYII